MDIPDRRTPAAVAARGASVQNPHGEQSRGKDTAEPSEWQESASAAGQLDLFSAAAAAPSLQTTITAPSPAFPSALMIAFPQARRVRAVEKIAAGMAHAKTREKAEDYLAAAVRKQRAAMLRKGVPPGKVDRECARLESTVRTRLWSIIVSPPPNDAA